MIAPQDYPRLILRGKAIQRDHVVRVLFGGQTRLAAMLRVRPSTVNHVIWFRKTSHRIERFILDKCQLARPDLIAFWQDPPANRKRKAA